MPTTSRGYRYPSSTDDVRPYEDIQFLATDVNTDVATLVAPPTAMLRQTTAQTVANATWTSITFTTEDMDTHSGHSTSSNTSRYTCQVAGVYELSGGVSWASSASGRRYSKFTKNGSDISGSGSTQNATTAGQCLTSGRTSLVSLVVGDYVEMQGYHDISSGTLDTYVGVTYAQSVMNVRKIGD